MSTAVFESGSKADLELLIKIAEKIGVKAKLLKPEEVEEICLARAIEEGRTGEYIDTADFLSELRK